MIPDLFEQDETAAAERRLREALAHVWGYSDFRPLQREAMLALAAGRDGIVVFPTGGGKSLCFQLPSVVVGPAVVISPLIALMHDQVAGLSALGVRAAFLNSTVSFGEADDIAGRWRSRELRLLYVSPERALTSHFLGLLHNAPPAFFAIDEAHCISQWGHDFRPEYRQLAVLRERFPNVPIHAYTATATERVREDIALQLKLRDPEFFVGDFDRPNLHYRVERRTRGPEQVAEILRAHAGRSGIVYCISRKDVEAMAAHLVKAGFNALPYHAGLDEKTRRMAQQAFTHEQVDCIVATVAFGMGIDRSNVRFVIHAGLPKSVEAYQQECGRAGRDGLPAECVLLYSAADAAKWTQVFSMATDMSEETRAAQIDKLREMDQFAALPVCRHRYLVEYFGQRWTKGECGNCDVCAGQVACHPDSQRIAQMILSNVARMGRPRGAVYNAWVLRGDTTKDIAVEHLGLSTFGLLRHEREQDVRRWVDECAAQGLLARDPEYKTLRVTALGWAVMRGQAEARLTMATVPTPKGRGRSARAEREAAHAKRAEVATLDQDSKGLFEALRAHRREVAREMGVPPYIVFHDTVLTALATRRPTTEESFLEVPGIGEAKAEKFGAEFIEVIEEYCERHGLATDLRV